MCSNNGLTLLYGRDQHNAESRGDSEHVFLVLDLSGKVPSVFPLRKMLLRKYSTVLIFLNG